MGNEIVSASLGASALPGKRLLVTVQAAPPELGPGERRVAEAVLAEPAAVSGTAITPRIMSRWGPTRPLRTLLSKEALGWAAPADRPGLCPAGLAATGCGTTASLKPPELRL